MITDINNPAGSAKAQTEIQVMWDYVAANNGMGFHSPQECMRLLTAAVDLAGECRVECARLLAQHDVTTPVRYPDFSTKEKALKLVGRFVDGSPPDLIGRADGQ